MQLRKGPANAPGAILFGVTPLAIKLTPRCSLWTDIVVHVPVTTNASGVATLSAPLGNDWRGRILSQYLTHLPGWIASNELVVQMR